MNKKGFTLIELLAVIIILGILMIIAIPSVTRYINDSRKAAYINTAKQVANATKNLVNSGKLDMYDTDVTYFVPNSCIKVENGDKATSPYGDFIDDKTYVVVTYDGKGYDYYWISLDETGTGIRKITSINDLDESLIESNLKEDDIVTTLGVGERKKIRVYSSYCNGYTDGLSRMMFKLENGDKDNLKIGDKLCIDTECFNIIKINGENITLLADYNLYVGAIFNTSHQLIKIISENDPNYLKQVTPEIYSGPYVYGATQFSTSNYWHVEGNTYPMNIYDSSKNSKPGYLSSNGYMTGNSNCSIAYYIKEYEKLLISKGASVKNIRIPYRSEFNSSSVPYHGNFWLGTASNDVSVYNAQGSTFRYTAYSTTGVRPCFEINKSDIK